MADMHDSPTSVVLIHGFMQTPLCWERWVPVLQERGMTVHTPAFPHHDGSPPELRQNPHPELAQVGFEDVMQHMRDHLDRIGGRPALVGHSLGGLVVQRLVAEGYGSRAVLLESAAPPGGGRIDLDILRANFPLINPLRGSSLCLQSESWYQRWYSNTVTPQETHTFVQRYAVPSSRKIARETTGAHAKVDFSKPHVPLLFIAGSEDRTQPPSVVQKNRDSYTHQGSIRDYREYPGRDHYIWRAPGWNDVADDVADWILEHPTQK